MSTKSKMKYIIISLLCLLFDRVYSQSAAICEDELPQNYTGVASVTDEFIQILVDGHGTAYATTQSGFYVKTTTYTTNLNGTKKLALFEII
jgi:hypothetical protein